MVIHIRPIICIHIIMVTMVIHIRPIICIHKVGLKNGYNNRASTRRWIMGNRAIAKIKSPKPGAAAFKHRPVPADPFRCTIALILLTGMLTACNSRGEIVRPASLAGLPEEIRTDVARLPYPCLVARDRTMSLMTTTDSIVGHQQTFMGVPVPGQPTAEDLPKGVDSRQQNLEFYLVGCVAGADIDALVTKGFADAEVMNIPVEIWAPTKSGWTKRIKPQT
jgi:hypothetical protein